MKTSRGLGINPEKLQPAKISCPLPLNQMICEQA